MADIIAGGLTKDQIDKLKKKHGTLTLLEVGNEGEDKIYFFLKKPNMTILSAVQSVADRDVIAATQLLFKECLVHGDAALSEDVDVFTSIQPALEKLIEEKRVVVKNF